MVGILWHGFVRTRDPFLFLRVIWFRAPFHPETQTFFVFTVESSKGQSQTSGGTSVCLGFGTQIYRTCDPFLFLRVNPSRTLRTVTNKCWDVSLSTTHTTERIHGVVTCLWFSRVDGSDWYNHVGRYQEHRPCCEGIRGLLRKLSWHTKQRSVLRINSACRFGQGCRFARVASDQTSR